MKTLKKDIERTKNMMFLIEDKIKKTNWINNKEGLEANKKQYNIYRNILIKKQKKYNKAQIYNLVLSLLKSKYTYYSLISITLLSIAYIYNTEITTMLIKVPWKDIIIALKESELKISILTSMVILYILLR